jgi:hypothetical protein
MPSTQIKPLEYATGAAGGTLAVGTTPTSLTLPEDFLTFRLWVHNPSGSGVTVFLIPRGSDNTTSGMAIKEGETLAGVGPYLATDFPDIVATGNTNVYFTLEAIKSEG